MPLLGSPITVGHIPSALERGLRTIYTQAFNLAGEEYKDIYTVTPSEKLTEKDAVYAPLGTYELKPETQDVTYDAIQEAYTKTFTAQTYAKGVKISMEAQADDLYGVLKRIAPELARAAAYTKGIKAIDFMNDLSATLYTAGGSNYPLLSVSHFLVTGATWANRPTNAMGLSTPALEAGLQAWYTTMVDQRGRRVRMVPKYLVVGPSNTSLAHRLVHSEYRPQSADNDVNWIRDQFPLEVRVFPNLTDDGRWFLWADPKDTAFRYNNRMEADTYMDIEPGTRNLLVVGVYRESHGAATPLGVYGSP